MIRAKLVGTWMGAVLMAFREKYELFVTALLRPNEFSTIYNNQVALHLTVALSAGSLIDVGAHIGSVSATILRRHHNPKIIAIEPVPEKASSLRRRFPSIDVRECALADTSGRRSFFVDIDRPGYSSLLRTPHGDASRSIEVDVMPLDELLPNESVNLVKIDVEGAELAVLRGAAAFTARCRPIFAFESGPWADAKAVWEWFAQRDYAICSPSRVPHDDEGFSQSGFIEAHIYPRISTNYIAIPRERRLAVRDAARRALGN